MKLTLTRACAIAITAVLIPATLAHAGTLSPLSYDMLNGNGIASGGSFNYWDLFYNGVGPTNVDNAPLSGGLGDLTDGVIAVDNWFAVENIDGTGPYVGWRTFDPVITFNFAGLVSIDAVTLHLDDSDGAGGVSLPTGVSINNVFYDIDETAAGAEPKAITLTGLGLVSATATVQLHRSNEWVFLSEVLWTPEPASLASLLALIALRRRAGR